MARTESLKADAEKFNTQSAFLLSALQKLQTSIESSQREKVTLVNNFRDLSEDCETLKEDLKGGLQNLQNESSAAAKNNETSAELIQRIECLLQETQGNHADSKTQVTETLAILEKAQQQQALYSSSAEGFAQLRDEAEGFVVETKSASEAARERSGAGAKRCPAGRWSRLRRPESGGEKWLLQVDDGAGDHTVPELHRPLGHLYLRQPGECCPAATGSATVRCVSRS